MSNILKGSINLEKLICQRIKTKKGSNALIIPIEQNNLVAGEKGIYANITVFINDDEDDYGNVASIKQDKPNPKKWAEMSDEEKEKSKEDNKAMPYLGNLKRISGGGANSGFEEVEEVDAEKDDLPF